MATVIRFARHGTKKKPYFRMVVQDQRSPRDGRFVEHIGAYDPIKGDASLTVKRDRLEYWLSAGAKPSDSVRTRLKLVMKQWAKETPTEVAPPLAKAAKTEGPAKESKVSEAAKEKSKAKAKTKAKEV